MRRIHSLDKRKTTKLSINCSNSWVYSSLLCCLILLQVSQVHNLVQLIAQMHLCIQNWDQKDTLAELIWMFFFKRLHVLFESFHPSTLPHNAGKCRLLDSCHMCGVTCVWQRWLPFFQCGWRQIGRSPPLPSNQHFWRRHPVQELIFLLLFTIVVRFCVTHSLLTFQHTANGLWAHRMSGKPNENRNLLFGIPRLTYWITSIINSHEFQWNWLNVGILSYSQWCIFYFYANSYFSFFLVFFPLLSFNLDCNPSIKYWKLWFIILFSSFPPKNRPFQIY